MLIVMTEITRNLTGIRDSPERRALYGTLMEDLQQEKPIPNLPLMQMKVRILLSRFRIGSTRDAAQIRMKRYMSDRRLDRRTGTHTKLRSE